MTFRKSLIAFLLILVIVLSMFSCSFFKSSTVESIGSESSEASTSELESSTPATTVESTKNKMAIALDDVNIRSAASTEYSFLGYVPAKAQVEFLAVSGIYCEIIYNAIRGFVSADKLSLDGNTPILSSEPESESSTEPETTSAAESSTTKTSGTSGTSTTKQHTTTTKPPVTTTTKPVIPADNTNRFPDPPSTYTKKYYIYVEKGSHTVTVYERDDNGNYSKIAKRFSTATGRTSGRTPVGTFTVGNKERWHKFESSYYAQFVTHISGTNIMLHSALYRSKNNNTLDPSTYNVIGTDASAGCLRSTASSAYFIYNNCEAGTIIKIVNGSPKKTSVSRPAKLASNVTYDPSDPFKPNGVDPENNDPTSVTLNKTSITLEVGETFDLVATLAPEGAKTTLSWTTNKSSVATVSGGKVTAKGAGTATITVQTSNGKTDTCTVSVSGASSTTSKPASSESDQ